MCQIDFIIQHTDAEGDSIQSAEGRYRIASSTGAWTQFVINTISPKTPDITTIGSYTLEVRIQDAKGAWSDWFSSAFEVSENCNGPSNVGPRANAGSNQSTTGNKVTLNGSNSLDLDGTITSYFWKQLSGPMADITNTNIAQTIALLFTNGTYVFELTVTDNDGATDTDEVQVIKKSSSGGGGGGGFDILEEPYREMR